MAGVSASRLPERVYSHNQIINSPIVNRASVLAESSHPTNPSDGRIRRVDLTSLPITEKFVRASGPGGQNVNKVSTAVELRLDVHAAGLPDDVRHRLIALAGKRITTDGVLVIDSREHRTQAQNRDAARARLSALLDQAAVRPKSRRKTKPTKAAKARRVEAKVQRATIKKGRGRIRDTDS
jgi:ribosome-associated protein